MGARCLLLLGGDAQHRQSLHSGAQLARRSLPSRRRCATTQNTDPPRTRRYRRAPLAMAGLGPSPNHGERARVGSSRSRPAPQEMVAGIKHLVKKAFKTVPHETARRRGEMRCFGLVWVPLLESSSGRARVRSSTHGLRACAGSVAAGASLGGRSWASLGGGLKSGALRKRRFGLRFGRTRMPPAPFLRRCPFIAGPHVRLGTLQAVLACKTWRRGHTVSSERTSQRPSLRTSGASALVHRSAFSACPAEQQLIASQASIIQPPGRALCRFEPRRCLPQHPSFAALCRRAHPRSTTSTTRSTSCSTRWAARLGSDSEPVQPCPASLA